MISPSRVAMGIPGGNSPENVMYNNGTKRNNALRSSEGKQPVKFADSRSLSWDYSPTGKSFYEASPFKGNKTKRGRSKGDMDSSIIEGPMDIDMETDDEAKREGKKSRQTKIQNSDRERSKLQTYLTSEDDVIHIASDVKNIKNDITDVRRSRETSPDVIPSSPTWDNQQCPNSTLVDTSVFGGSPKPIAKSASLNSLQPSGIAYFRTTSPQGGSTSSSSGKGNCDPVKPFRRSSSSQSLSTQGQGQAKDVSIRIKSKFMSGTLEAISNMIISKSGVTPKAAGGTMARQSPNSHTQLAGSPDLVKRSPGSRKSTSSAEYSGVSSSTSPRYRSAHGTMESHPASPQRPQSAYGGLESHSRSPSSAKPLTQSPIPNVRIAPASRMHSKVYQSSEALSPSLPRARLQNIDLDIPMTSATDTMPEGVGNIRATPEVKPYGKHIPQKAKTPRSPNTPSKGNTPGSKSQVVASTLPLKETGAASSFFIGLKGTVEPKSETPKKKHSPILNNINPQAPTCPTSASSTSPTSPPGEDVTGQKKSAALTRSNVMTSQVDTMMLVSLAAGSVTTGGLVGGTVAGVSAGAVGGGVGVVASALCMSGAKEYIMDKYFEEIAKSWDQPDNNGSDGPPDVSACGREFSAVDHQVASPSRPMMCWCGAARGDKEDSVSLQGQQKSSCNHKNDNTTDIHNSYSSSNLRMYTRVHDLIHLDEPLTEEAVIKTLQARFYTGHYYTHIGPLLVLVNPLTHTPLPNPICSTHSHSDSHNGSGTVEPPGGTDSRLHHMLQEATRQQLETGLPQTLLLNGISGSGKTHASMILMRGLFDAVGGGVETDAFKHLQAALTVLRSLGSAATCQNPHSSRMGYMVENNISDGAIYRTKIHCYFIDQTRVVKPQQNEKNFHIFYQMLAGLTVEERAKYQLTGHSSHTLNFLSRGDVTQDDARDREHFLAWKNALSVLGIPFGDIMRALAAVLLLGNMEFVEGPGLELQVEGEAELQSVACLLGVTTASLYRGLSTRTRRARGQIFKALADPQMANQARDALAKALYCRLVAAIIKRANNTKRLVVNCANSTDSGDSGQNDVLMQDGLVPRSSCLSRGSGNGFMTSQVDSFISVLDMFGFEKLQSNHFEQLCTNLCSETLQHFYNTHMFRAADEACAEEAITADIDITYYDNAPNIELLSSLRVGILSLLDAECGLQRGCPETFLQKVHIQHSRNKRFFEPTKPGNHAFGIRHFCCDVTYDARDMLTANRNQLADDVIATFTKQNCSFGFVSHLFSQEIKAIQEDGGGPKGAVYRISPSPVPERNGELKGSLSSDFHNKLDGILQLLVSSRPHFVRCIKSNDNHQRELFEREVVKQQLRALQLLETLHLMAAGFPHRMRYRMFNNRYHILLTDQKARSDKHYEESKLILDKLLKAVDESDVLSSNAHWALGKKYIFLSEGCRQLLEQLRDRKRNKAATIVQARWRRRMCLKKWPTLKRQLMLRKRDRQPIRRHVRRGSLQEASTYQRLEDGQRIQQAVRGNVQVYVTGQNPSAPDRQNGSHYGSHDYLYGHQAPLNGSQINGRLPDSQYGSHSSLRQSQSDPVYSQQNNRHGPQMTNGHRRHGSHDLGDSQTNGRLSHQSIGPGRYSFHGDTRQSRPVMADTCNQKPRSRSSERHYITHSDVQRQFNSGQRQRSYSSHSEFRNSLPANHPQGQRQGHIQSHVQSQKQGQHQGHNQGQSIAQNQRQYQTQNQQQQGSRLSHASSGSGSNSGGQHYPPQQNQTDRTSHIVNNNQQHQITQSNHHNPVTAPTNGHTRVNGVASTNERTPNSRSYNSTAQITRQHANSPRTNSLERPCLNGGNQHHKGNGTAQTHQMINGHGHSLSRPSRLDNTGIRTQSDPRVPSTTAEAHPPPVPASRTYTVKGNMKLGYPQIRIMKENYHDNASSKRLGKGSEIKVVGCASRRGYLLVELGNEVIQVPFSLTDLKSMPLSRTGIDV